MQRVITTLVSDLSGQDAQVTVEFGLDGQTYAVDLTDAEADDLRDALRAYLSVARKTGRKVKSEHKGSGGKVPKGERAAVRAWAREQGYAVGDRGRIASEIVVAYRAHVD